MHRRNALERKSIHRLILRTAFEAVALEDMPSSQTLYRVFDLKQCPITVELEPVF
jgi:hypothetical protein